MPSLSCAESMHPCCAVLRFGLVSFVLSCFACFVLLSRDDYLDPILQATLVFACCCLSVPLFVPRKGGGKLANENQVGQKSSSPMGRGQKGRPKTIRSCSRSNQIRGPGRSKDGGLGR
ncbi:hypothetical protein B0T10DRAFT_89170 [Thelonectria olida]|uniref:Transmembrane protein n=1 Tax=Thelonectria olida TaxID=1576542 RepID=A0A9P9AQD5_9HYPO|nr:hypothetical protein B0T10DRAFT_89170 [Thelonectria olida]